MTKPLTGSEPSSPEVARDLRATTFTAVSPSLDVVGDLADDLSPPITIPSPVELLQARRNTASRVEMLLEFGAYTGKEVADLIGSSAKNRSAVASRLRKERRLVGVDYRGSTYYPAFQFRDGEPLPLVADVLVLLNGKVAWSDWEQALWFLTPTGWLDGRRPVDVLQEPEIVLAAAAGEVDEFGG